MRKKLFSVLIMCVLIVSGATINVKACMNDKVEKVITQEALDTIIKEQSNEEMNTSAKGVICCGGMSLVWRQTTVMHIYPSGGGKCLGIAYFGDQYCQNCGAVWKRDTCYKQTSTGCGSYHK